MTLKLLTYNIHSCIDTMRAVDMERTARVIAETGANVVALQEVDVNKARTGRMDQARWLADRLGMNHRFYPVVKAGAEWYGLAVLASLPMQTVRCGRLPAPAAKRPREVRGVMWIRLSTARGPVNLFNTHLGLRAAERLAQIRNLLGGDWIGGLAEDEPVVFCGDFNAGRRSPVYREINRRFVDVHQQRGTGAPQPTFLSFYPILCLDHIFVSPRFSVVRSAVPSNRLARRASDHLPVFAELLLTGAEKEAS